MSAGLNETIVSLPKNAEEELVVSLQHFHGYDLVSLWIWFLNENHELKPTKKGINLRVELLPTLIQAIEDAASTASPDGLIAFFPKNKKEEVRVAFATFNGHDLLAIRAWYRHATGEMRPSAKGISIRVSLIPDLLEALLDAEARAQTLGLLPSSDDNTLK